MRPASTLLAIALLTFPALPAAAQFETATVVGTVRDTSGAVVADAHVSLTNLDTGVAQERSSDAAGNVEFFNVRIGRYVVTADKDGFSVAVVDNVQVTVGARQRVDVVMAVGQLTEKVEVVASSVQLQTDSSDRSQVISGELTRALPLNGREYSQLALLSPGVRLSALNTGGFTPREGSFNVNGLRSTFNNFLIDGVDNNAYGTSNQGFSNQVMQPSPDAVAEFKVVTNNMSAEYGRSAGATINVAYASGTNQFRGAAWDFIRRTDFNATGFFKPANGEAALRPRPVRRRARRADGEEPRVLLRRLEAASGRSASSRPPPRIPTLAQRQGILSVDVRHPLTGVIYPAGTPMPMTAFARKVLTEPAGADHRRHGQQLRRLAALREQHRQGRRQGGRRAQPAAVDLRARRLARRGHLRRPADSAAVGRRRQRLDLRREHAGRRRRHLRARRAPRCSRCASGGRRPRPARIRRRSASRSALDAYGITGLPDDPRVAGGLPSQLITGYSDLGRQATNPQWQYPTVFNPKVNYSWLQRRATRSRAATSSSAS